MNQLWIIAALMFGAVILAVQAIYWLLRYTRRTQKAINRRLALSTQLSTQSEVLEALRRERGFSEISDSRWSGLNEFLVQTGLKIDRDVLAVAAVGICAVYFALFGVLLGFGLPAFILAVIFVPATILGFFSVTRRKRMARFAEQLPDALDVIVRGLRAGYPFTVAVGLVAKEMPDPIGTEFGMISDEIAFGMDAKTAMHNLFGRVGHEDLLFLIVSITVQSQTGGNLAEVLSRLSRLLRNRSKLHLKIRALTAEGRMSAIFLSAMPFVLVGVISLIFPKYYTEVAHHPLMVPAIVLGLASLAVGNFIIYRMVHFKV
jgi:tight adherence protein B